MLLQKVMWIIHFYLLNFTETISGAHAFFKMYKIMLKKSYILVRTKYGEKVRGTCYEDQLVNPTNPYSASKQLLRFL